jgi:hypothetical protein
MSPKGAWNPLGEPCGDNRRVECADKRNRAICYVQGILYHLSVSDRMGKLVGDMCAELITTAMAAGRALEFAL